MNAKICGVTARIAGVAVTLLCLASGDGGLGLAAADVGPAPSAEQPTSLSKADFKRWLPQALAGDPQAAFKLGRAYSEGTGRWEDFSEAAHWFRRAAQAGHGQAQADLGLLYGKGLGVPQDYVWSYAWFAAAAANLGYGRARDQAVELRDMMAAFLSAEDRARADRLAEQLKELPDR